MMNNMSENNDASGLSEQETKDAAHAEAIFTHIADVMSVRLAKSRKSDTGKLISELVQYAWDYIATQMPDAVHPNGTPNKQRLMMFALAIEYISSCLQSAIDPTPALIKLMQQLQDNAKPDVK